MSYFIQICWSDNRVFREWEVEQPILEEYPFDAFNPDIWREKAIKEAKDSMQNSAFEGDYVRVITNDGELVWDSRTKHDNNHHM